MAHPGAYRGNKRQKEIKRLDKQKEKREKRLVKKEGGPSDADLGIPDRPLDGPVLPEEFTRGMAPEKPEGSEEPSE